MKKLKLKMKCNKAIDKNGNEYISSDFKDIPGLLLNVDSELKHYDLELRVGDFGDDQYWICVIKR